jgi:hypothetical protein
MNTINFTTEPDGFPLESDATLGFLQANLEEAISALAKIAGPQSVILHGLVKTGSNYSDGWILFSGELLFFEGGVGGTHFVIDQTVTQKANENGNLVDRYFVRKARFGSGSPQYLFSSLEYVSNIKGLQEQVWALGHGGLTTFGSSITDSDWVVLGGLRWVGGIITGGRATYRGRILEVPPYTSGTPTPASPIYLSPDGEWTASSASENLKFDPETEARTEYLARTRHARKGELVWIDTAVDNPSSRFDGSGLGKYEWAGWAIANGNNGTTDRTGLLSGLLPVVKL